MMIIISDAYTLNINRWCFITSGIVIDVSRVMPQIVASRTDNSLEFYNCYMFIVQATAIFSTVINFAT